MKLNKTYEHKDEFGNIISAITKVKEAQMPERSYQETSIDKEKKKVDFLLTQTNPYYIQWQTGQFKGNGQKVNGRHLKKLKKTHTWATDF